MVDTSIVEGWESSAEDGAAHAASPHEDVTGELEDMNVNNINTVT